MQLESESKNNYPNYRWVILSLLFAATTINYLDRTVLSVVVKYVKEDLHMDDQQYSYVVMAFLIMYTIGYLAAGRVIDWLGTKLGYLLSILSWSAAVSLTGLSGSISSLAFWQGLLGITEGGNFPAAIKSVAEWFPAKERALATSLFNSGPSIALVVGPIVIAAITLNMGWRWTFAIIGASGFVLVAIWPFLYKHPKHAIDNQEQEQKPAQTRLKWRQLLKYKETYGIMICKFFSDPVWYFYIFWLPNYLYYKRGFNIKENARALVVVYGIAIVLGNFVGWVTGYLIRRGWTPLIARKIVMFACAMCMPFSAFAVFAPNPWVAILLVSLACSAHNGWSANTFSLISDCFPSRAVGSAVGFVGFVGSAGGILATYLTGVIVKNFGYVPIFMLMGILHPLGMVFIHLFVKKGEPIQIEA